MQMEFHMTDLKKPWYALVNRVVLLRYLFLIRKTYLIKFWNVHFSQWGEDVVIERFVTPPPPREGLLH